MVRSILELEGYLRDLVWSADARAAMVVSNLCRLYSHSLVWY